jgi:hypothetical protein
MRAIDPQPLRTQSRLRGRDWPTGGRPLQRFFSVVIIVVAACFWVVPAKASADMSCYPSWKLIHPALTGCDNMALLQPGNDTRANLVMLLADERGRPLTTLPSGGPRAEALFEWNTLRDSLFPGSPPDSSGFVEGEGSRCRSNRSGTLQFEAALAATSKLPDQDRTVLVDARRRMASACNGSGPATRVAVETAAKVLSARGKSFAVYLQGAAAFYEGDFVRAAGRFADLRDDRDPWLQETSIYMLGRVALNRAQVHAFDEYGYPRGPEHVDRASIEAAEGALSSYLRVYPKGRYSASARGLIRRVYWLAGRTRDLAAHYSSLFTEVSIANIDDGQLAEEIDNKLLANVRIEDVSNPLLLAILDLRAMRTCGSNALVECATPITLEQLEAQRPYFSGKSKLFTYLQAAHAFYVRQDPEAVLALISDEKASAPYSYIDFSRQMLRRLALERLGRASEGDWIALFAGAQRPFQRPALELALAMHFERSGMLTRVFQPDSPFTSPTLREILLVHVAGPDLLRAQATSYSVPQRERDVALFTLLYRELSRGLYRPFLSDLGLVPSEAYSEGYFWDLSRTERIPVGLFTASWSNGDFPCPPLPEIARKLDVSPSESRARLCLAEFLRTKGFDDTPLEAARPQDELGGTLSLFPGPRFSRLELYKSIIADPRTPPEDRAYALYRAVHCYAPSGYNSCGGVEVPEAQRQAWFTRLKKDFPASRWAKALRYYW